MPNPKFFFLQKDNTLSAYLAHQISDRMSSTLAAMQQRKERLDAELKQVEKQVRPRLRRTIVFLTVAKIWALFFFLFFLVKCVSRQQKKKT